MDLATREFVDWFDYLAINYWIIANLVIISIVPPSISKITVSFNKVKHTVNTVLSFEMLESEIQKRWKPCELMKFKLIYKSGDGAEKEIQNFQDLLTLKLNEINLKLVSACFGFSNYKSKPHDATKAAHFKYPDLTIIQSNDTPFITTTFDALLQDKTVLAEATQVQIEIERRCSLIDMTAVSEYTMREFISPILIGALKLVNGVSMMCEKRIVVMSGCGPVDYVMVYQNLNIVLTEAKKEDIEAGMNQNIVQQEVSLESLSHEIASLDTNGKDKKRKYNEIYDIVSKIPTFGIVTNAYQWQFLLVERSRDEDGNIVATIFKSTRHHFGIKLDCEYAKLHQAHQIVILLGIIRDIIKKQILIIDSHQIFQEINKRMKIPVGELMSAVSEKVATADNDDEFLGEEEDEDEEEYIYIYIYISESFP